MRRMAETLRSLKGIGPVSVRTRRGDLARQRLSRAGVQRSADLLARPAAAGQAAGIAVSTSRAQ